MLLFGESVDAEEAQRIGLVNRVVPEAELAAFVTEAARKLAAGPTLALATTKRMLQRELDMDLASALESEVQAQALLLMAKDHAEFYKAWCEKRPPTWSGR